jgi:predicted flap endonuclease-1-like 5' DNA nuclease
MIDQLKPVSNWEYIFLFCLCLICFLVGYLFSRKYYKKRIAEAEEKYQTDTSSLRNELMVKQAEMQSVMAMRNKKPKASSQKQQINSDIPNDLGFVKSKIIALNFDRIGEADPSKKDDLKKLKGVGPFIADKLNRIGIYNFEQISRFNSQDIEDVTKLIRFFPGRIKRDDWVGQATKFMNVEE